MRLASLSVLALALGVAAPAAAQQADPRNDNNRFWLGVGGGVQVFETPGQTRGGMPMAGGNLLIKAKRSGLMISFAEGIGNGEQTAIVSPSLGTTQLLSFNDIRTVAFHLMAFPIRSAVQPYFGIGGGIISVVNPQPTNTLLTPEERATLREEAQDASAFAFYSAVGGVNFNIGRVGAFGQYTYTSPARDGKLLTGPTHQLMGGLRFNLGSSKESLGTGGY